MPKYALPPQWRNRRAAIGKKNELESEMLMESELIITTKPYKYNVDLAASPTTISSAFDFNAMPAMKPLPDALEAMKPLPGAWMVVGKGGRPLKDTVMYDEPIPRRKKKKHNRARKPPSSDDDDSNVLADLAEEPSTSTCEQMLHRSMMRRERELGKKRDLKYWEHYREEKQHKIHAHNMLIYVLADGGMLEGCTEEELSAPEPLKRDHKRMHDKGSRHGAKIRRQNRFASAVLRCYSIEEMEWSDTTAHVKETKPSVHPTEKRRSMQEKGKDKVEKRWLTTDVIAAEMERNTWTTVSNSSGKAKKRCTLS